MFGSMFRNMPGVVKNLVIINALFYLATVVLRSKGMDLGSLLGSHYPTSEGFQPYQYATHFFMHGSTFHLLFNMIALIVFGSQLERTWGAKRFLTFYMITALGSAALHLGVQMFEVYQVAGEFFPEVDILGGYVTENGRIFLYTDPPEFGGFNKVGQNFNTTTLGASGAVYGLIAAFAMLFPNTQLMLLFPPIPIKAKYLALALAALALYQGYKDNAGDSIAHFAHLGGMVFGFIIVKIWQRNKNTFY